MTLRDQMIVLARSYCAARGLSLARVSTLVFNDGKKLTAIEGGADLQTIKFEQAMAWFAANWPDGVAWPDDVPRPVLPEVA